MDDTSGTKNMTRHALKLPPGVRRYGGAALAVAIATLIRWLLQPYFAFDLPFITFFAAVFVSAWLWGVGPALLAVVLSAVVASRLFFPPPDSAEAQLLTLTGLTLFSTIGLGAAALGEGRLRAQRRAEAEAAEARQARETAEEAAVQAEEAAVEAEESATQAAESAAQAEEQAHRLSAIVDWSDDAIITKDLRGVIQSWNPAAERIFGYTAAEVVGQSVLRLIPPELHAEEQQILAQIARGEHVAHYETTRVRKDGQRIMIALTVSPIRDAGGALIGASAIKRDITRQHSLEEQLRHSQQLDAIGQLAGGVAHDFNNVLAAISGYVGLLLRGLGPGDARRNDALGIQEAVDRGASLTQQLLAFGRKQVMQPELVDLREVLDDTGRMLQRLIGEHIDLAIVPGPILSPVLCDRGQLNQVIVNLAVNARDAMLRGGRLTIEARDVPLTEEYSGSHLAVTAGHYVLLAITDTGHGMTPEVQGRIFEPFFTTKPQGKGTGLGLSTVFGIVKQLGGHIFVYSEPGQGTTFKVYLPRAEGAVVATPAAAEPEAGGTETVLLVEDNRAIREIIGRILQMSAYTVLAAGTPAEALALAGQQAGPIHLLLTDVILPGMSGRELADRLLAQRPGLLVLYMSGYPGDAIVHQGRLDPDTEFLQKPFSTDVLLRQVRDVLGRGGAGSGAASA
jgi:two-component system cell cycle sensor histidine kinase/response regulator CckA